MIQLDYKKAETKILLPYAKKGNIKALEALLRNEQKHIYALFAHLVKKRDDISDLTQEVLLKIAKNIVQLKNDANFKAWVDKIITNTYYDYLKKHPDNFEEINDEKAKEIKEKTACEPGEKCIFWEIEEVIRSALFTLPRQLRLALVLREYEGLSYSDISKIMQTTLGTVKSRISRARFRLQDRLKEFI